MPSSDIKLMEYTEEIQYTSLPKPSLLEWMKLLSLLERFLMPTSKCLTIGTKNGPSATWTSSKKRPKQGCLTQMSIKTDINKQKKMRTMSTTLSVTNRSTDNSKLTQSSFPGLCQTELKATQCKMNVTLPGIPS